MWPPWPCRAIRPHVKFKAFVILAPGGFFSPPNARGRAIVGEAVGGCHGILERGAEKDLTPNSGFS